MVTILELAESHLLNVQREIQTLTQRKAEMENETVRMTEYLQEGLQVVEAYKQQEARTDTV